MSRKLTQEEYVKRVENINPNIDVLEDYINNSTKILHKCKIDGYEWYVRPSSILSGSGCPRCSNQEKYGHDEYVKRVKKINSKIEVVGIYVNSSTPILHRCLVDGYEWYATPNNILRGKGCPVCGGTMLKTHEQYAEELKIKNPLVIVIEKYVNNSTRIAHRCLIHNYEWKIAPSNALKGCGCPMCIAEKAKDRLTKDHDDYIREVCLVNKNIEVLGRYINSSTKILHRCLVCGFEWSVLPHSILGGHGCPMCAKIASADKRKKTHKEYVERVKDINPNIEVLEEYIDARTPILHRCKIDNYKWHTTPDTIIHGRGICCPICAGNKKYSHEEYIEKIAEINPNIEVLEKYIDGNTPILHKCKVDGCEWMVRPSAALYGSGCPKCNISKGEKEIANWLDKKNILYEHQKKFEECKNIHSLPFDFYLPDYNVCIEYNGKQHYEPIEYFGGKETFEAQILRDNIKKEYCQKNNILLFEIPYYSNLDEELIKLYNFIIHIEKGVAV